jgi:hypothetical protein
LISRGGTKTPSPGGVEFSGRELASMHKMVILGLKILGSISAVEITPPTKQNLFNDE